MKPCINIIVTCNRRGAVSVVHEDHGAYGRDGSVFDAVESAVCCSRISAPVVSIDDESAATMGGMVCPEHS